MREEHGMRLYLTQRPTPRLFLGDITKATATDPLYLETRLHKSHDDEWLRDFTGTALFDEAVKLCERELNLKIAHAEKQAEPKPDVHGDSYYAQLDRLRLEKQKLGLALAKVHHQRTQKLDALMSKAKDGDKDDLLESLNLLPGADIKKEKCR